MNARLARLRDSLGALGISALALRAGTGAFQLLVVQPLEAQSELAREAAAQQLRTAQPAQNGSAAEKVAAVYHYLHKDEETTDWLAKLHGISVATGVQLKAASYRTESTQGRIQRYQMVLPVSGSYVHIRDFLRRSLAEIPVMSLDQLTLKRESRNDGVVQAELRLTLHIVKS